MKKLTRRDFLRLSTVTAAGALATACAAGTPMVIEKEVIKEVEVEKPVIVKEEVIKEVPVEKIVEKEVIKEVEVEKVVEKVMVVTAAPEMQYKESPMLAARVQAGELPPVDERLPLEPLVIVPFEETGQYGGTLHIGTTSTGHAPGGSDGFDRDQNLLRIHTDNLSATPNVAKAWKMEEDGKGVTTWLRKGMKWSDGAPFTADDVMFWYEDYVLNDELTASIPATWRPGGRTMGMEKIDDYTFSHTFARPFKTFIRTNMAHSRGHQFFPAHFMKDFHITYNPEANAQAKAAGFDFWYQWFGANDNPNEVVGFPTLKPYVNVTSNPTAVTYERNPYFWAVDVEGNQLPYIDKGVAERVADRELLQSKMVAGDYDLMMWDPDIRNYQAYRDNQEAGDYRILMWDGAKGSDVVYHFNMTYDKDPVLRDIFRDKRFRHALSLAINRDEVNRVIYYGTGIPRQLTVVRYSRCFKPEYETAYAEYDPETANALLDEMGLEWDAAHEVRLRPDGKPLEVAFDFLESETPKAATTELMTDYWGEIGFKIIPKEISRELLRPKIMAGEEPMGLWHADECTDILFLMRPKWFAPIAGDESVWGVPWGTWDATGGEDGQEPPPDIKDLYEWLDLYIQTDDPQYGHKILESQAENVWSIGVVGQCPHPIIVKNNMINIPEDGVYVWDNLFGYPYHPSQFSFKG